MEEVKSQLKESVPWKEPYRTHYFSQHGVVREEPLTTKLRVVFDGSAKVRPDTPGLNECLHTGPSSLPTITDILHRVALVAEIEKAFHTVYWYPGQHSPLPLTIQINPIQYGGAIMAPPIVFPQYLRNDLS